MKYAFHIVDVFSSAPFGGNQLAVLPDATGISAEGMQKIAREFNFSETTFVLPTNDPHTYRVRIFTPRAELDFAGHPSVGTACALVMKQHVRPGDPIRLILEENVGPVIVDVAQRNGGFHGTLTLSGKIEAPAGAPSPTDLAAVLSVEPADVRQVFFAGVGLPICFAQLSSNEAVDRAAIDRPAWAATLSRAWSPHLFFFAGNLQNGGKLYARMWAPAMGIEEDNATGSACAALVGAMASKPDFGGTAYRLSIEQGVLMGRRSEIEAQARKSDGVVTSVSVAGATAYVASGEIDVPPSALASQAGTGGSMNRSMRSVMVGAAGLAVLGMTATLSGAPTGDVKEKPPLAAGARPAAFALDDVMQAPFAWNMAAAPTGTAVAWVFNVKGCSNVWVADPHGAKARQITPYTGDDGFDIGELAWSPDTKAIAFTRGQSLEDETAANVNSSPQGPMPREVWVVATAGGVPHKVGAGGSPSFSPDGSRLLFVDKKRILSVAASGDGDAKPLLIDQGAVDSLTWAPDGKRLAFVSHRGSHSLIGVYDFVDQAIVWLSPSLDYDSSPAFSPDGARIAFIHVLAEKAPDFFSRRSGRPWSIWTADVKTGQGRRVWIADAGPGSVFRPTISTNNDTPSATNLFWTQHDDLVFPWEKNGWQHLYAVPVRGGAARALTAGKFEVTHVAFSHDRKRLAYSSTEGDTDRMHIWTVDAEHGSAVRTAQSHAIEDFPQFGADGALFAVQSDGNQPVQPVALSAGGQWRRLAPEAIPSSFPSSKLAMPQAVTFAARDGQETHAQLFLPRETGSKPHPAILFFHGGPQRQMLLGFDPKRTYSWIYAFNQYLVARGYIVLSVNYRGGTGYGLDYREADNLGPGGASELNDLLGAITYLRGRQDVDPHRLGIWGGSYGGYMTALGLARASDALAAGVDYSGIHDWSTHLSSQGEPIDGGDANRRAVESSPIGTIDQWHSPVLLVQADDDRAVPSQQATELIEGLRSRNIDHDVIMVPNEIHDMARYSSWMMLFNAADVYFDRQLHKKGTITQ